MGPHLIKASQTLVILVIQHIHCQYFPGYQIQCLHLLQLKNYFVMTSKDLKTKW